ncbi:MAG TPA: hypothetical protein VNM48_20420 [Chloroflexota bacterium]|nr:hypothetical protein [Chloroflexota bacterium]
MASTYAPYAGRSQGVAGQRTWPGSAQPVFLLVAGAVFIVSALAMLVSQADLFQRAVSSTSATTVQSPAIGPTVALAPADIERVLSYARAMQPDDALIQARPGVFAKQSNVQGVTVNGATVYYDIVSHQSYGPLRSGQLTESQVKILARDAQSGSMILIYAKK